LREKFKAGKLYRVEGPAAITVIQGEIEILGKRLKPKEKLVVPKSKSTSFRVIKEALLEVRLGSEAKLDEIDQPIVPPEWEEAVRSILGGMKPCKVVVIGNVDSGKTTFTLYLANQAVCAGLKTFVIDKDVGQSDIGAPTTIGLGFVEHPVTSLSEVSPLDGFFVGTVSPAGVIHRVILGARILIEKALGNKADVVIVNTSGWVMGRGARELKWSLIMAIEPEYVVALERGDEVEHIIKPLVGLPKINVIRLPAPLGVRSRNREERRMLREANFKRHLVGARIRSFQLGQVGLIYSIYGSGRTLPQEDISKIEEIIDEKVVYAEVASDCMLIIIEKEITDLVSKVRKLKEIYGRDILIVPKGHERGIVVGLNSKDGRFLGIGVIKEIKYQEGVIRILTNVNEEVGMIQVGQIKIDENGKEIGKYDGWML